MELAHRIGVDENGLGARLGPLVVTAVLARVNDDGRRMLDRKLPKRLRADLDDSKRLVKHGDVRLGEAWARVLARDPARDPAGLLEQILLEGREVLSLPCPKQARAQCWSDGGERFEADTALAERIDGHRRMLATRGVELVVVKSKVLCTKRLNELRVRGVNRFVADLHAMESLVLALREVAGENVRATCGKVGMMGDYGKFFGPLSGHLHAVIEQGPARSAYYVPNVGEVHFVRDADASDPLVMLASLVGKYVRELLMGRIARFYSQNEVSPLPSGYHDQVTRTFVNRSALTRGQRRIPIECFERAGDADRGEAPARPPA